MCLSSRRNQARRGNDTRLRRFALRATALDQLSARVDADEIIEWRHGFRSPLRQTFITHDGPAAAAALRLRIEHELKRACHLPYCLESVSLD